MRGDLKPTKLVVGTGKFVVFSFMTLMALALVGVDVLNVVFTETGAIAFGGLLIFTKLLES